MKVDSLDGLRSAFAQWRRSKKHAREAMPEELLARARRVAEEHGVPAVVRVTRVERSRLFRGTPARTQEQVPASMASGVPQSVPPFSRLELSAPLASRPHPIAEVETSGVTLRVFEQTPEMMRLLSTALGFGGRR